jgi:hypothetical protein
MPVRLILSLLFLASLACAQQALPAAAANQPYAATLPAQPGVWFFWGYAYPPGITAQQQPDGTLTISGTPTTPGAYTLRFYVLTGPFPAPIPPDASIALQTYTLFVQQPR